MGHSGALEILNSNNKIKRQTEMKDAPILVIYIGNLAYVYNGLDSRECTWIYNIYDKWLKEIIKSIL